MRIKGLSSVILKWLKSNICLKLSNYRNGPFTNVMYLRWCLTIKKQNLLTVKVRQKIIQKFNNVTLPALQVSSLVRTETAYLISGTVIHTKTAQMDQMNQMTVVSNRSHFLFLSLFIFRPSPSRFSVFLSNTRS